MPQWILSWCCWPTRDRHQCRSGVSARRSVPPRSRSDQPFGRCARKCLNTHTDRLTNTIRPTFFSDPPEEIFVHKNVLCIGIGTFYSLRFWTRGRHCLIALPWAKIVDIAMFKFNSALSFTRKAPMKVARPYVDDAPQPPCSYGAKLALPRCTHVPSLMSLAQSSLSPEDPTSKQLLRPWRVQLAPDRNGTPNGF